MSHDGKYAVIPYAEVGPGNYWMYDTDPEYQREDPSLVTVSVHDGVTYVTGANAGPDEADIACIDDIVETVVFFPIVAPQYWELAV